VCTNGAWQLNQDEVTPQPEDYANEFDDDCDGSQDEIDLSGQGNIDNIYDCTLRPSFIRLLDGASLVFNCTSVEVTADLFEMSSTSSIDIRTQECGSADGERGAGDADGGGGGGGAHIGGGGSGGNGGWRGVGGGGGTGYGTGDDFTAEPGSCGGAGGGPYGAGGGQSGGAITIVSDTANIMGAIHADGGDGGCAPYDDGGGGGGSGGSILIVAGMLSIDPSTTMLSVHGGLGGCGGHEYAGGGAGGGGGGGSVELRFDMLSVENVAAFSSETLKSFIESIDALGCFQIAGGESSGNGGSGQAGSIKAASPR
jgi:hypothetical protein